MRPSRARRRDGSDDSGMSSPTYRREDKNGPWIGKPKRKRGCPYLGDSRKGTGDGERIAERALFPMIDIHSIKNKGDHGMRDFDLCFDFFFDVDARAVGLPKPYSQRIPFIE